MDCSMAQDLIQYDALAREALRGVVREALRRVVEDGLPGSHHFYITFKTHAAGVDVDPKLVDQFPDEMTIVLEHRFWDLSVDEDAFEVTLEFNRIPKYIRVPFDAVIQFHDPSVNFGLRFDLVEGRPTLPSPDNLDQPADAAGRTVATDADQANDPDEDVNVVSLDAFRKKPS